MKQTTLALVLLMATAFPATAEESGDGIRAVISAQLDALRAGDITRAFDYASTGIQGKFGTPETFGKMVENGYAMVIAPAEVRFLELRERDGGLWQKVLMRDAAGAWHTLDYEMVVEDGAWQIDGVQVLRQHQVGA